MGAGASRCVLNAPNPRQSRQRRALCVKTPMQTRPSSEQVRHLRSRRWFENPDNPDMTTLYLERSMNFGLALGELSSGKPIIGIAQSGSDLSPCNRHHLKLAERVRDGIREAGGVAIEFP